MERVASPFVQLARWAHSTHFLGAHRCLTAQIVLWARSTAPLVRLLVLTVLWALTTRQLALSRRLPAQTVLLVRTITCWVNLFAFLVTAVTTIR